MKTADFKKILLSAIDKEVESYTFYTATAGRVKDKALQTIFKELAEQETMHRKTLQEYLSGARKELRFDEVKDYHISDTIESPVLTTEMKPLDGLKLAIKKEEEAKQMYEKLAAASVDDEQKNIFNELAKMETGHKARLEDIYTNTAFAEAW
ncbi:MAG: ferritin family protein [Methanospirillum sp.]|uniref:ferritin-like domain-containing protein n=1 Tax=Methanospirillum sp. TaxID=45200 RepID=UPI002370EEE3|nr:ferritin family protein [Methanospirillum sp.]MDD1728081.1 ferritin family protein [Methanospirillum sp.]